MDVVGKKKRDPEEIARLVQLGLARGLDLVEAFRQAQPARKQASEAAAYQAEHRAALERHQRDTRRYRRHLAALHRRVTAGTVTAATGGVVFVASAVPAGMAVWPWGLVGLSAGAVGGAAALSARHALHEAVPPPEPRLPLPPPPPLRPGARGQVESAQLAQLRIQLAQVVPLVERLHPGAAEELRRADAEAAPPLGALVERLAVLDRMERDMHGTQAAAAAAAAAEQIRSRLAAGCATYERLLAAAATLLAAPDPVRSTDEVLAPALEAMSAYASGLAASAEAFTRTDPRE